MGARRAVLAAIVLASLAQPSSASGLDRFAQFLGATQAASGEFEQTVTDRNGKLVQRSRGSLVFQRPGKFRWTYLTPYAQLIVGDGTRGWIYDEDLRQVTVRRVDQALTSTPAALLGGNNAAMRAFQLTELGQKDGLDWVEAVPRDKEGGFERVRMGFGPGGLERMELHDSFGQVTLLRFSALTRNPALEPSLFRFSPPKGVDVVGE